jgi:hypothetical protein
MDAAQHHGVAEALFQVLDEDLGLRHGEARR